MKELFGFYQDKIKLNNKDLFVNYLKYLQDILRI